MAIRQAFLICSLFLASCTVLNTPDVPATLVAENEQIIAEATAIAVEAARDRELVQRTAVAAYTQAAEIQQSNLVLLQTVQAGGSGVTSVVVSSVRPELTPGQMWFHKTGVSAFINEADGCVVSPQIAFTSDASLIYATLEVYNVRTGIQLSASWEYEGTEVHREGFPMTSAAPLQCYWFSIDASTVDLLPGNWTVRLFADGIQLESPMAFAIREAEAMMDEG